MAKKRVKKGKHIIFKVWIDDQNSVSSMRFFFNAPSKSSHSGRAKILMNFIEFHWISLHFWWHFTKIWPARSRLYQRIFEFSLRDRRESAFISQFLQERRQTSKEKREKNRNESHDFLMRLLIVKVNKLVWIITRRNWLVSKIALEDHQVGFFCVTGPIFSLVGGALGYHSSFFILHSFLFQGVRVRGKG